MSSLLFFDKMLTPKIITVIYWLMLFGVVITGLGTMFGFGAYGGFSFTRLITGLMGLIGGVIGARVFCEILIVVFKMNDALQELRNK